MDAGWMDSFNGLYVVYEDYGYYVKGAMKKECLHFLEGNEFCKSPPSNDYSFSLYNIY